MKAPAANWGFHVLDESGRLPSASCVSAVSLSASVAAAWQSALRRPVCVDIHIVPMMVNHGVLTFESGSMAA